MSSLPLLASCGGLLQPSVVAAPPPSAVDPHAARASALALSKLLNKGKKL